MAFLSSAGFLGLHALATPGALLPDPNAGFEARRPTDVLGMLNEYWAAAVPVIDRALGIVSATDFIAAEHDGWPRFRIGLNTGSAVVGNVGAAGRRSFAAIGETTNLASRLLGAAQPGQVVMGADTLQSLQPFIQAEALRAMPLGPLRVKGKSGPIEVWSLATLERTD